MTAAKANEKQTMRVTLSKRTSFRMGGMKQDERRAATASAIVAATGLES